MTTYSARKIDMASVMKKLGKKTQDAITGTLLLLAAFPVVLIFEGWFGTGLGFAMMFWGVLLAGKPLSPILVRTPYVGVLVRQSVVRFALAAAAALTLVFLIVEWLWYHLLVLCLIALSTVLVLWLLRDKIPWMAPITEQTSDRER